MTKLIRTATVPQSLNNLLVGQLKFLNERYEVIAVSGYDENLENVKQREGVQIVDISMCRNISPVRDFISLIKLTRFFLAVRPQIVHSITPKAGLLTMLAGMIAGVPVRIHTFTGLIFPTRTGMMQKMLIYMDRLLCYAATDIYPEGLGVKRDLISYRITKKPLRVIANGNVNGIDSQYFNPQIFTAQSKSGIRKQLNICESDIVFIFVGRLVTDKGINELVAAFNELSLRQENVRLLLLGDREDHLDPLPSATINEIVDNKRIVSLGFQKDIRPYLSSADCLAFPSYREGFPNVVLQAGAMNLPSIVTDINGSNEIIVDGRNGRIIPSKNIDALVQAMEQMLVKETRDDLARNARKMILERYEREIVWTELLNEYIKLEKRV